jgi:hypothetical protein
VIETSLSNTLDFGILWVSNKFHSRCAGAAVGIGRKESQVSGQGSSCTVQGYLAHEEHPPQ